MLVLARKPGTPAPAPSTKERVFSMGRSGRIVLDHASMKEVARLLGRFGGGKPGVDETGLAGFYDFKLEWMPEDAESQAAALAAYGLELRAEPRKVPVLHARLGHFEAATEPR